MGKRENSSDFKDKEKNTMPSISLCQSGGRKSVRITGHKRMGQTVMIKTMEKIRCKIDADFKKYMTIGLFINQVHFLEYTIRGSTPPFQAPFQVMTEDYQFRPRTWRMNGHKVMGYVATLKKKQKQ